ncbi:sporulation transcriptional regulator SpoIIID [Thermanaeromonas sp. C210]|uniref:sporulation transcriptional regulator SpoIIID n=1 Tax=Thermanaeromonas sp. C210 TaxID=2731925 RepID=UPI00155B8F3B|nr:sporulation transcriptional regulator SpoIIID [Thermanaeromonas sp. C210]GFN21768.1 stage III sporulation protein D [Thermanaeromonas sp. C210]
MQDHIRERVLKIAAYLVQHNCTVRQAANVFAVSKSTVHKDVTERLPRLNKQLAGEVRRVLDQNKAERHLRGGEATRKKYKEKRISPVLAE